ncbi:MAG TPA: hypothetical protein VMR46_03595 [Candidatus Paceibacterota bacterium]|nr:hypothetical protein [Candidatus Paceibacterota bacterium]
MKKIWKQFVAIISGQQNPGEFYFIVWALLSLIWLYGAFYTDTDSNLLIIGGLFIVLFFGTPVSIRLKIKLLNLLRRLNLNNKQ